MVLLLQQRIRATRTRTCCNCEADTRKMELTNSYRLKRALHLAIVVFVGYSLCSSLSILSLNLTSEISPYSLRTLVNSVVAVFGFVCTALFAFGFERQLRSPIHPVQSPRQRQDRSLMDFPKYYMQDRSLRA